MNIPMRRLLVSMRIVLRVIQGKLEVKEGLIFRIACDAATTHGLSSSGVKNYAAVGVTAE
ncbi:hypothetical protein [Pectobacterium carotovorum]|uniref:Uncharacterized protein n=1 Tax=Pectobacterium carotovorum subsp. carotovorum (strain PC1) TaxID=561230 RepID=C6DAY6_PECCP|nr:hypothetical protein [Pectobacterium carotovorum]ACT12028.1 hypothetical protein PC1_0978 [Pectobacterium carotovorum subsp. carotovorum PC1]